MWARRGLQEPLLHFLLIGLLLFVLHHQLAAPDRAGRQIVVSQAMVDELAREHEARWTRKPSTPELAGLVEAYVRDEILYREGLALGLDRDDALIKRRVRQKYEVMAEEQAVGEAPSDADLQAYMNQNASRFMLPGTLSFEHIFFDNSPIAVDMERAIAEARAALARGADPTKLGRASMLPGRVENTAEDLVARDFGSAFVQQLKKAPLAEWSGPISSGFGAHLVRVSARTPGVLPPLDAVRRIVAREWENLRRERSRSDSYQNLRQRYAVVIEANPLGAGAAPR